MKTYIFNGKFMSDKYREKSVFIAMEGDNNSGIIPFEFDRYYPDRKGVDLGEYTWQLEVKGYILPNPHENVIGELTGLAKEVRGSTISIRWIVGGENAYLAGEGEAQLKAIGANGEVWKSEPFTVVVGQSINADGVAELYPSILTELSARALALEGRMDTAESDIETLQGNVDALGSDKQDKYDETLTTTDKTVVGAINEVKNASDIAKQTADIAKNTAEAIDGKATEALSTAGEAKGIAEGAEGAVADKASLAQVDGKIAEHNVNTEAHADKYVKPETGIPKTDLAAGVQTSLGKADSAVQTETDPTVPAWAKAESKPTYVFAEINDKPTTILGYGITDAYTKSEVDGKVASVFKYKGAVTSYGNLPTSDRAIGDVWDVTDTGKNYAWNGTAWDDLGGMVDLSNYYTKSQIDTALADKVDKVADKGLSTEDYTTTEKTKLFNIAANAQVNPAIATQAEAAAGTDNTKMMTPQRVSQAIAALVSDAASSITYDNAESGLAAVNAQEAIDELAAAPAYTLPTASAAVLGGVKVGENLTIENGVLNAPSGGWPLTIKEGF